MIGRWSHFKKRVKELIKALGALADLLQQVSALSIIYPV